MNLDTHGLPPWISYLLVAAAALISGIGFFFSGQWIDGEDASAKIGLAVLRTLLTLLPALAAYWVASWREKKLERRMAQKISLVREQLAQYSRLQSVQNELDTVDRLSKVARNAVVQMGTSANELLRSIETVREREAKEMLLERYRTHTSSVVTLLNAVGEQVAESGQKISDDLTADQAIHIVERADRNVQHGLEYADKILQSRGIGDGVKQLKAALERAQDLQKQITATVTTLQDDIASALEVESTTTEQDVEDAKR